MNKRNIVPLATGDTNFELALAATASVRRVCGDAYRARILHCFCDPT